MTTTLSALSDQLWSGQVTTHQPEHHPFAALDRLEEVAPGVGFYKSFVNVTALATDAGLALVDTGTFSPLQHEPCFQAVRQWNPSPLDTAIYTHGHVDHAYGLPPYLSEAEEKGWARPAIVAHERVPARMQRYVETAGYNGIINERQFGIPMQWPTDPIAPTTTYTRRMTLDVGGLELVLTHALGETDDHTWVWIPERKVVCTGDLFIWASPNAGNPQKVQRYAASWAQALREMAGLAPEVLLPGHGLPVFGADRVERALSETADYLDSLYRQTLDGLNAGATIYDLIHTVKPPRELEDRPYLQPIYDEPEFIVRNVYRHLAGWYTGIPSELKPAPRADQAREIAAVAGGLAPMVARAEQCLDEGRLDLASHWIDWASEIDAGSQEVNALRARIYGQRTVQATSTMARGVFGAEARMAREREKSGG